MQTMIIPIIATTTIPSTITRAVGITIMIPPSIMQKNNSNSNNKNNNLGEGPAHGPDSWDTLVNGPPDRNRWAEVKIETKPSLKRCPT